MRRFTVGPEMMSSCPPELFGGAADEDPADSGDPRFPTPPQSAMVICRTPEGAAFVR
jgi:hypothetical protein